jgi:hypothetical protein
LSTTVSGILDRPVKPGDDSGQRGSTERNDRSTKPKQKGRLFSRPFLFSLW